MCLQMVCCDQDCVDGGNCDHCLSTIDATTSFVDKRLRSTAVERSITSRLSAAKLTRRPSRPEALCTTQSSDTCLAFQQRLSRPW